MSSLKGKYLENGTCILCSYTAPTKRKFVDITGPSPLMTEPLPFNLIYCVDDLMNSYQKRTDMSFRLYQKEESRFLFFYFYLYVTNEGVWSRNCPGLHMLL